MGITVGGEGKVRCGGRGFEQSDRNYVCLSNLHRHCSSGKLFFAAKKDSKHPSGRPHSSVRRREWIEGDFERHRNILKRTNFVLKHVFFFLEMLRTIRFQNRKVPSLPEIFVRSSLRPIIGGTPKFILFEKLRTSKMRFREYKLLLRVGHELQGCTRRVEQREPY